MTKPFFPEYAAKGVTNDHQWVRIESPMYSFVGWILTGPPESAAAAIESIVPPIYWKDCQDDWEPKRHDDDFISAQGLILSNVSTVVFKSRGKTLVPEKFVTLIQFVPLKSLLSLL